MSEGQRQAQVEMLMKRVVIAEAALKTMKDCQIANDIVVRALARGKSVLDEYLKQYPDSGQ